MLSNSRTQSRRRALEALASAHGIAPSFRSAEGRRVIASDAALEDILSAFGVPMEEGPERALGAARRPVSSLPPILAWRRGEHRRVRFEAVPQRGLARLRDEHGGEQRLRGGALVKSDGALAAELAQLGVGYYWLDLETRAGTQTSLIVVAPPRSPRPARTFGVFAPLYGLRSERDWGIGTFSELQQLLDWATREQASFVGLLPIYAAWYEGRPEVSPYLPVSRLAWNEIYLDVEVLEEYAACEEARVLTTSGRFARAIVDLRAGSRVDYESVYRMKRTVLDKLAAIVDRGPRRVEFRQFLRDRPDIVAYADFRAQRERLMGLDPRASRRYHRYVQFATSRALSSLRTSTAGLYLDLPLGVHPEGFDVAHYPSTFLTGPSIGAPPDLFFPGGQDWKMPAMHPEQIRKDGYRYFIACLRRLFEVADMARIDHVMGLERCYLVPDGHEPTDGAYVRYRSEELRAILSLEAARHGTVLVGEDLGTVPPETRRAMRRDGMLRSFVYQLEVSEDQPEPAPTELSVASFGTHDLPRFAGWCRGADLEGHRRAGVFSRSDAAAERRRRGGIERRLSSLGDTERGLGRAYRGLLASLATSAADVVLVDAGDLTLEQEPENRPGPLSGESSWRRRMASTVGAFAADAIVSGRMGVVRRGRGAGRSDRGHRTRERGAT